RILDRRHGMAPSCGLRPDAKITVQNHSIRGGPESVLAAAILLTEQVTLITLAGLNSLEEMSCCDTASGLDCSARNACPRRRADDCNWNVWNVERRRLPLAKQATSSRSISINRRKPSPL